MTLIIANILTFISNGLVAVSSFCKTKHKMIFIQFIECCIGGVAEILANSMSAAAQLFLCSFRNAIIYKNPKHKQVYWLLASAFLILGLIFNNRGLIGLLPIFATIQYTLWSGYCKNAQGLRYGILINYIPWIIHDFYIKLYVSAFISLCIMLSVIVSIIKYRNKEKIEAKNNISEL